MDKTSRNLIDKLLDPVPQDRIGYSNYSELKTHPFFEDVDFESIDALDAEVPGIDLFLSKCEMECPQYLETEEEELK